MLGQMFGQMLTPPFLCQWNPASVWLRSGIATAGSSSSTTMIGSEKCPPPHVFSNVEACIPPGTYEKTDNFVWKLHKISRSQLLTYQWCYTHTKYCPLFGPAVETDLEVAGLPCWDFSRAGERAQEEGATNSVFMSHAKRHKEKKTPFLIVENVEDRVGPGCVR